MDTSRAGAGEASSPLPARWGAPAKGDDPAADARGDDDRGDDDTGSAAPGPRPEAAPGGPKSAMSAWWSSMRWTSSAVGSSAGGEGSAGGGASGDEGREVVVAAVVDGAGAEWDGGADHPFETGASSAAPDRASRGEAGGETGRASRGEFDGESG